VPSPMPWRNWLIILYLTCVVLLISELFAFIAGCVCLGGNNSIKHKIVTAYAGVSFIIGLPNLLLPIFGYTNVYTVNIWVLATIIAIGLFFIAISTRKSLAIIEILFFISISIWLLCVFVFGFDVYNKISHVSTAIFGISCAIIISEKDADNIKWMCPALFADVFLCSISMAWHADIPMFWSVRNMIWAVSFFGYGVTRIT